MSRRAGPAIHHTAKPTLTPVELDPGERLRFRLRNGRVVALKLLETEAAPLVTNILPVAGGRKRGRPLIQGKTVYGFACRVEVDGHGMTMQRYVGSQETFCEPYVVNGMRIWFDAVDDIFTFLRENHGECRPSRKARFAVQDAALGICPERVFPWYAAGENFIDVRNCYRGDDPFMGAYAGEDAHGGLDVDMPEGTPLYTPVSVDDQHLVRSVRRGDGNNRWEGRRTWPDGSTWLLKCSHVASLAVRERTPLKGGACIGRGAGMAVGYAEHSHFIFDVEERGRVHHLDPWIVVREAFERRRDSSGEPRARMECPGPGRTGSRVRFRSRASGRNLRYYWTFGDGGFSTHRNPGHVFARPGLYPVTLTVDSPAGRHSVTCHLTVDGPSVRKPVLRLAAPAEFSFRPRPDYVAEVHGVAPRVPPHTVSFTAMSDGAIELHPYLWAPDRKPLGRSPWTIESRRAVLHNAGAGRLGRARPPRIVWEQGRNWLEVRARGSSLVLTPKPRGLPGGLYRARVEVAVPGALDSPQSFRVEMNLTARSPFWHAAVDDLDPECAATPYFWVAPRFPAWWPSPGHGSRAFFNGYRARKGEFVRYTPYLWGGLYEVLIGPSAPVEKGSRFLARVRHARGTSTVPVEPAKSRRIGKFVFSCGSTGWVDILAEGSKGQVAADCLYFIRLGDSPKRSWDVGLPGKHFHQPSRKEK